MKSKISTAALSALLAALLCAGAVIPAAANQSKGSIKMNKPALELAVGETDRLTATGADVTEWSSSDESVVKVGADGTLTGVSVGKATVTAKSADSEVSATVYVVEKEYSFDDDIMISIFWPPTEEYLTDEQYQYMEDAGITWQMAAGDNSGRKEIMLKMAQLGYAHGVRTTIGDRRLGGNLLSMRDEKIKSVVEEYRNVPGANGYYMLDEPFNPNDFIDAYRSLKEADPHSYMHLNFLPYASYPSVNVYMSQMNDWLKLCAETGYPQDYLMYDLYPFGASAGSFNRGGFLTNIDAVRRIGLQNNVKTGTYIQTVCIPGAYRSLTRAETLYEINMALAFGIKQLSYFTWFTPHDRSEPFEDGIISVDGKPNKKFEFICELGKMVHTVGKTLAKCDSLEVYESRDGAGSSVARIPKEFFVASGGSKTDFTVSYLRDRTTGRNYCMVVNNNFTKSQQITLKFDDGIKSLEYLSYEDGQLHPVGMTDGSVTLDFEAGGAYIFALPEGYDRGTGEYTPQKGENLAKYAQISADSSAGAGGWYIDNMNDGKRFSAGGCGGWQSRSKDGTARITVDLGAVRSFNRMDLYPAGTSDDYGAAFPSAFSVYTSADGAEWEKTAEAENFEIISKTVPSLRFGHTEARYVRIEITGCKDKKSELCEIEIYDDDGSIPEPDRVDVVQAPKERGTYQIKYKKDSDIALNKTVKVSTYPTSDSYRVWGWYPDFLVDGSKDKGWTSDVKIHMNESKSTEYAVIDLGDFFNVETVKVFELGCWPYDFELSVSEDGQKWEPMASETNSPDGKDVHEYAAETPLKCRYVKFTATKLRSTSADGYMLQLGEIEVYGKPYKDLDEAAEMIAEYVNAGGSEDSASCAEVKKLINDENATQSQLDSAMKKMLGEYSLKLKPFVTSEPGKNAEYEYKFIRQTESVPQDTAADSGTEPDAGSGPADSSGEATENSGNAGKTNAAAIIAAVCAGVVIIGAAAYMIISGKKKK